MSEKTNIMKLNKPLFDEMGWDEFLRQNADIIEAYVAKEHNADGTHNTINTPNVVTPKITLPDGTITSAANIGGTAQTLAQAIALGKEADLAGVDFALKDGTRDLLRVHATKGLQGMIGNIMSPLVHIPFKRANDEVALSGVQTFTRADTPDPIDATLSKAVTYLDPLTGLVTRAALGAPRFERMADGSVGILMEGRSDNLCIQSGDFSNAAWQKTNVTFGTPASTIGGGIVMNEIINGSTASYIRQTSPVVTSVANQVVTLSAYIKAGTSNYAQLLWSDGGSNHVRASFDAATGAFINSSANGNGVFDSSNSTVFSDGTIRIELRCHVTSVLNMIPYIGATTNGNTLATVSGETLYAGGMQVETLPFASSYIPTTSSALSRAADGLTIPMRGNILNGASSIALDFISDGAISAHRCLFSNHTSSVTTTGITDCVMLSNTRDLGLWYNGANLGTVVTAVPDDNLPHRLIISLSNDGTLKVFFDGALTATKTGVPAVASPDNTSIGLGGKIDGTVPLHGGISNFRTYDRALTDAEMGAA